MEARTERVLLGHLLRSRHRWRRDARAHNYLWGRRAPSSGACMAVLVALVVARGVSTVCCECLPYVLYGRGPGEMFYAFWDP
jgi:hypothetical protein